MKIGSYQTSGHQHLDAGHFQIYYKGILASDSGVYQGALSSAASNGGTAYWSVHTNQYGTKTVAHNCMLVYDPSEGDKNNTARGTINDGGQRSIKNADQMVYMDYLETYNAKTSEVEKVEIDPKAPKTPEYSYIKGDLTKAYSDKVKEYKRSFMFLNLENSEVPAAMIVFDKITSSNPSFKKSWLLHGLEEPEIDGNRTVFRRTYRSTVEDYGYNGKLTVDTLLPKDNTITKIGGEGMWSYVNGVDYTGYPLNSVTDEGNSWRIEISPKNASERDYFLNVLQVSDNDKEYYVPATMIESEEFYGAAISDRVVLFSKSGKDVGESFEFNVPEGNYKYTVCDVGAGEYTVSAGGKDMICAVSEEGGVLAFDGAGGKISVRKTGSTVPEAKIASDDEIYDTNKVSIRINDVFVHTFKPAVLKNNTVYIDGESVKKYFGASASETETGVTFEKSGKKLVFENGSNTAELNGEPFEMSSAAERTDGSWMIPARAVAQGFGGSISWDKYARTAYITKPNPDYTLPAGYAKVVSVTDDGGPEDGANVASSVADGLYETRWTAEGRGRYIILELQNISTVTAIEIAFNPHAKNPRDASFDVFASTDGKEYTWVYSGVSNGATEEGAWESFEFDKPYAAKYIKYVGNGSNVNAWNAVKEMRLKLK